MLGSLRRRASFGVVAGVVAGAAAVLGGVTPAQAALDPSPFVAFDNIDETLDPNYTSIGVAATSTNELGDLVRLEPGQRVLDSVTVVMSSWACQAGAWTNSCATVPGEGFFHDITLTLYSVSGPDTAPVLGSVIHQQTDNFFIPFRPSSDPSCPDGKAWKAADGNCYSGLAVPITFEATGAPKVLPARVVWTVAFNTSTHGYDPEGVAGHYDSLNVAVETYPAVSGTNVDVDDIWTASTYGAGMTCDAPNDGTLVRASNAAGDCWTGYQPMARIVTRDAGVNATTQTVYPHSANWAFLRENPSPTAVIPAVISAPPAAPPAGLGTTAAQFSVASNTDGKTWATPQFDGTRLADITELGYWVYTDTANIAPSLAFDIRYRSGDTNYGGRLVYEPVYNGGIAANTWTYFDGTQGKWWSSNRGANGSGGETICQPSATICSWDEVMARFPDAQIDNPSNSSPGNLVSKLGSGVNTPVTAFIDGVTIGVNTPSGSVNETVIDWATGCSTTCYVDDSGSDANSGLSAATPLRTIQAAVNAVSPGGTVHVAAGTYEEDVNITKSLSLIGAGADDTTIIGQAGGASIAGVRVGATDVLVEGFTVTREGNNLTEWNDATLNTFGIVVEANDATIRENRVRGNRTGIDVRGNGLRTGLSISNNEIVDNRTGVIFYQGAPGIEFTENVVSDNWTVGILFQEDPGGPFTGGAFTNNDLSGNWYGAVVSRYALHPEWTIDFSGNYFGPGDVTITTDGSAEPGYAALIPTSLGGTAVPPAVAEEYIAGAGSGSVDVTPYLASGADTDPETMGFQGDFSELVVSDTSHQIGATHRVQEAENLVDEGGTVRLEAGTYPVSAPIVIDQQITLAGPNAGINPNNPALPVNPNAARVAEATLHAAGINRVVDVGADGVTIDGLRFTDDPASVSSGNAQIPLIAAGRNYHAEAADDLSIVNNVFDQPDRIVVYTNSVVELQGITVDDNRVVNPSSLAGCENNSACGRQLFNLWDADDVSFSGNTIVGTPGNGHRTRILTVINEVEDTEAGLTVADNTIRYTCNFTCFTLSQGIATAEIVGNDVQIDAGNAVSFYQPGSGTDGQWTGGDVDIHHNRFAVSSDYAIAVGNPSNAGAFAPDLSGLRIYRNSITGGGIRSKAPVAVFAECNYWGSAVGASGLQNDGLADVSPFLTSSNLNAQCGTPESVVATAGDAAATVTWQPTGTPAASEDIEGYTVTASPGGATCSTDGALTCTVDDLTNGTEYTFTVVAHYASGDSAPSAPSNAVTPLGVKCSTVCYVSPSGHDTLNTGATATEPLRTIQAAVALIEPGGTIHVLPGTYEEDVNITKSLSLLGAGADHTTVVGPIGGAGAGIRIGASDVVVDGFTVTRAGNTVADWNNAGLNTFGVLIEGADDVELSNNVITGNRTGLDVRGAGNRTGLSIHNNAIVNNRSGVLFWHGAPGLEFVENTVSGNWTTGVLFHPDLPVGSFASYEGARFFGNDLSGNWYAAVEKRNDNQETPFQIDFSGNYFGAGEPTFVTTGAGEPGYAALIPVAFGGSATAPATQTATVTGADSAVIDVTPYLASGADTEADTLGFQGDFSELVVSDTSDQVGTTHRVQEAEDLVDAGGTVRLEAGTYPVSAPIVIDQQITMVGPNAGIDPNDADDATLANGDRAAEATLHATGAPRILTVAADGVTVDGVRFSDTPTGGNSVAQEALISAASAQDLTLVNNVVAAPSRSILYAGGAGATVESNRVTNPTSSLDCVNTCGRQLFNFYADDVAFTGNTVLGAQGPAYRTRVLLSAPGAQMVDGITIADNTIRDACNFTCFSLAFGVNEATVVGNDVELDDGNVLLFYIPNSGTSGQWTGGTVDVNHNRFDVGTDVAISVGNRDNDVDPFQPDLSGLHINRNAIVAGGILSTSPDIVDATCNYWGSATGPDAMQLLDGADVPGNELINAGQYLVTADLDGDCSTVPSAPQGVTATPGIGEVTVSWSAPADDGGLPVAGYTVTANPGSGSCTTASTSCVIDGLTAGTSYSFSVVATNAAGSGAAGTASATPQGVPGAPQSVSATGTIGAATITWLAPASTGGLPVTGYTVTATPGGASCSTTGALGCVINGLDPGTTYTFAVHATNAAGDGAAAVSNEVTPNGTPGAVTNVSAVPGIGTVTVSWSAPASDGGQPITGYTVVAAPGGAECVTATLSCELQLTAGTAYTFFVVATNAAGNGPGTLSAPATPQGVPGAPLNVTATPGVESASVTWAAPANGGLPITGYTVTVTPGGATCTTTTLSCAFGDLTGGTEYIFSVVATNAAGDSAAASDTAVAEELPPVEEIPDPQVPDYVPVGPLRLFDTRGVSNPVLLTVPTAKVGPDNVLEVQVAGVGDAVPEGRAAAVSMNVTATNTSASGFVTVFPCGTRPEASNLNYVANTTVANAVISPLSASGKVCFYSKVPVDLVVDVNGWFLDDDSRVFEPITPTRVFDTRGTSSNVLTNVPVAKIKGGTHIEVPFAGLGDGLIPASGVGGVSLNVTATNSTAAGYVTVFPCGELRKVSNVNVSGAGQTVPNAVISPLSPTGSLCFYASRDIDLVVDINGWLSTESMFETIDPVRVFDTRGQSPDALVEVANTKIGGAAEVRVRLSELGGAVPATGVGALSLNVTAVETGGAGFITVYPCGERAQISSLNFTGANQVVANAVIAPVSDTGEVCFYSKVATHLVVDLNGWASDTPFAD